MTSGAAPARPDGELRTIRSFTRRGVRLNVRQQDAWDSHAGRFVLSPAAQTAEGFLAASGFEVAGPLLVEIGFGIGEALAPAATGRPGWNVLGFEVWRPGVADCLAALAELDAENVRLSTLDATWAIEHLIEPDSVAELWTFFPDPWPKTRHHKRRLVNPGFAALAGSRLVAGGVWRLATDWAHYAEQMQAVLDAEPLLEGGVTERYTDRPMTRFERRGLAAGRQVTDLAYRRLC